MLVPSQRCGFFSFPVLSTVAKVSPLSSFTGDSVYVGKTRLFPGMTGLHSWASDRKRWTWVSLSCGRFTSRFLPLYLFGVTFPLLRRVGWYFFGSRESHYTTISLVFALLSIGRRLFLLSKTASSMVIFPFFESGTPAAFFYWPKAANPCLKGCGPPPFAPWH